MNETAGYLQPVIELLTGLVQLPWVRDVALILLAAGLAYFPSRFLRLNLRRRRRRRREGRPRRLAVDLIEASLWPVFSLAIYASAAHAVTVLVPDFFGDPLGELPILGFFLIYRIANVLVSELTPPGVQSRPFRRLVLPLMFVLTALQQVGVLGSVMEWLRRPLFALESVEVSPFSLLAGVATACGFIVGARIVAVLLQRRFLPGVGIQAPLSDTVATVVRYTMVGLGIFVAVDTVGFDLSSLKIAFGALGVGIGFGMQNLVNNFVSGLILIFEQTIKRSDIISVSGLEGRVVDINLRSSVVRTRSGHDIIIPNSDFATGRVTNYSFSDRLSRVELQVGTSYSSDPNTVRDVLLEAAAEHSRVLRSPAPSVLLREFAESALIFELRLWVNDPWPTPTIRSDLYFSIWYKLKDAGITVPFPQRDLHVRSGELPVRWVGPMPPGMGPGVGAPEGELPEDQRLDQPLDPEADLRPDEVDRLADAVQSVAPDEG